MREQAVLDGIEAAGAGELRLDVLGEGEVHVVAAEQQVVADGLAEEAELAVLLDRLDQAEVGGAAADVDDETEIAGPDASRILMRMAREPAIKCRLRFFEEGEVDEAGLASGIDGERAGHVVERRGDGEDDLLLLHRRRRMTGVPGVDEMLPGKRVEASTGETRGGPPRAARPRQQRSGSDRRRCGQSHDFAEETSRPCGCGEP